MENYDVDNPASMTVEELLHTCFRGIVSIFQKTFTYRTKNITFSHFFLNEIFGEAHVNHRL